jgi:hypothetical protein
MEASINWDLHRRTRQCVRKSFPCLKDLRSVFGPGNQSTKCGELRQETGCMWLACRCVGKRPGETDGDKNWSELCSTSGNRPVPPRAIATSCDCGQETPDDLPDDRPEDLPPGDRWVTAWAGRTVQVR